MQTAKPLRNFFSLRSMGLFLHDRRWLIVAFAIGAILYVVPPPEGLAREGQLVLIISLVAVILFVTEPVPLPSVALMIIIAQITLLGLDSGKVARSLMSDSVLFIMGSLMLAVAIVKQKLDKRIAYLIVRATGTGIYPICVGISFVCGVLASIIGEHTVAAMMLPVAITLVTLTSDNPKEVKGLAAVLLFSISYGCAIGGIGTPSGGARNAIMISYWKDFFFDPTNPETRRFLVDYVTWIKYAYPIFLAQLPLVTFILFAVFKPERKTLRRAVAKLRKQIEVQGPMNGRDWAAVGIFLATLVGWVTMSESVGLGTVALFGAVFFLVVGLVPWNDMNSGVNWGVVWLYAATISLGVEMQASGAAEWVANSFLELLGPLNMDKGMPLLAAYTGLTTLVTNTMSAGAAVAVLGPIALRTAELTGENPLYLGFITAISSSFAYFTAAAHPAFTIVYASGYLRAADFFKVGWRMAIMSAAVLLIAAKFYWPLLGLS
jgi:solute carrier family 13 (sodium-dependent dicarboxylate transporter), member 2/3/5